MVPILYNGVQMEEVTHDETEMTYDKFKMTLDKGEITLPDRSNSKNQKYITIK